MRNASVASPRTTASATASGSSMPSTPATPPFSMPAVIAVRTACGASTDTLIPLSPNVIASHSASASAACLVTEYGALPIWVSRPAADAVCRR